VDKAIVPLKPSKPRKSLIVSIAAVLAAVMGIGLTLLFEALNNTFKSTDDVENKLNVPVFGVIPMVAKKKRQQIAHMFEQNDDKRFCESIRTLRTSLVLSDLDTPRQIVLVTSSVPGEGKSSIASNLAFSIAHIEKVLLIDADLRRPTMARNFDFPVGTPGLANLIAGTAKLEDCIRTVGNVDMMPAGMVPPIGMGIATFLARRKFAQTEREAGKAAMILGLCFISEGAIPFAAKDPLRVIPASIAGGALTGALSMYFGCKLAAPHGGLFVLVIPNAMNHALLYLLAIAAGSVLTGLVYALIKRPEAVELAVTPAQA